MGLGLLGGLNPGYREARNPGLMDSIPLGLGRPMRGGRLPIGLGREWSARFVFVPR